jgi:hypothetical protein
VSARFFTIEEANALLPEIRPLVSDLLEHRTKIIESRQANKPLLESHSSDFGGAEASEMAGDFIVVERLLRRIRSHGCTVKDINAGLVDFLSVRDGREVYLCWKFGEATVSHYHELHAGYLGRQPI